MDTSKDQELYKNKEELERLIINCNDIGHYTIHITRMNILLTNLVNGNFDGTEYQKAIKDLDKKYDEIVNERLLWCED